ncbi:PepSY domain-containing protein [Photobacterium atrarenae]|uniref:PepSY domain-containing protein n=1 Tax=Photobacterium atrarenae TaxID=865757 RepID=A0ABY5GKJ9_9GAMM|nr:PepSY domain-containing protein [Photobacterium atrarenae]UTV29858.1 PepSY domain-containing protein [Photobacterium atrarenae]
MKKTKALKVGLWLATGMVMLPAVAEASGNVERTALSVPKAMKILQGQGYHDFRKIKVERDDHEIEVEARDSDGQRVEIEMDLYTGKVISIEAD